MNSADVSADKILDSLDFAFMGAFGGRKGPRGVVTDVIHPDLGAGDSDLTWQGMVGLGYSFNSTAVTAAWRYLDYDMGGHTPIQSISCNGPALRVTFRF